MKKTAIFLLSLILLVSLSACAAYRGGQAKNLPAQNQRPQTLNSPNQAADNGAEQTLNDLEQSLSTTDTLDHLDAVQPSDPQVEQGVNELDTHLNALQNALNTADNLQDVK